MPQVRERLLVDRIVAELFEQVTGVRAGDVDGRQRRSLVDDEDVEAPGLAPVEHPGLEPLGARRGDGAVERTTLEGADGAVVDDDATLFEHQAVAQLAGLEVGDAHRVDALEELDDVRTGQQELAERADVDDADAMADGLVLGLHVAVREDALPRAGPEGRRAHLQMLLVERGVALDVVTGTGRGLLDADRADGRAQGRRCRDARGLRRGLALGDGTQLVGAEAPLARSHRHRRIALEQLGGLEALVDRLLDLLDRHVLAETDVAGGAALARLRGGRVHVQGQSGRCGGTGVLALLLGLGQCGARQCGITGEDARQVVGEAGEMHVLLDLRATGEDVAADLLRGAARAADDDAGELLAALGLDDLATDLAVADAGRVDAGAGDDRGDGHASRGERLGVLDGLLSLGPDDGRLTRLDAVSSGEARGAARHEDARQVVVREDAVHLHAARRDHDVRRVDVERLLGGDRQDHRALVDADGGRAGVQLDAGVRRHLRGETVDGVLGRARGDAETGGGALVDDHHALAGRGCGERSRQAGDTGADDEHVGMAIDAVDLARRIALVREAKTGDAADNALSHRPCELRLDAGLVVEADGHQRMELVDHVERVTVDRRPGVLPRDLLAILGRAHAGAHVDLAVNRDEAVRAVARQAVEATRAVVLEGAGEDADAIPVERRGERVARLDGDFAPLEFDAHAAPSVYSSPGCAKTRFVRVSRTIVYQRRVPLEWNHRSFCTPATLARSHRWAIASSSGASGASGGRTSPPYENSLTGRRPNGVLMWKWLTVVYRVGGVFGRCIVEGIHTRGGVCCT